MSNEQILEIELTDKNRQRSFNDRKMFMSFVRGQIISFFQKCLGYSENCLLAPHNGHAMVLIEMLKNVYDHANCEGFVRVSFNQQQKFELVVSDNGIKSSPIITMEGEDIINKSLGLTIILGLAKSSVYSVELNVNDVPIKNFSDIAKFTEYIKNCSKVEYKGVF
jgi:anti-sigma regulatory factor (Ser/Thr protein kinase)